MRQQKRKSTSFILALFIFTTFVGTLIPSVQGPVVYPQFTLYVGVSDGAARFAISGIIRDAFRAIGIDARLAYQSLREWIDCVFYPNISQLGATYTEGGWDLFFFGWSWDTPILDPTPLYDSKSIPLSNFMLLNDSVNDALLAAIRGTYNKTERWELLKDWQTYIHDISSLAILLYLNETFAYDPTWTNFEDIHYLFPVFGDPIVRHSSEADWIIGISWSPDQYLPLYSSWFFE